MDGPRKINKGRNSSYPEQVDGEEGKEGRRERIKRVDRRRKTKKKVNEKNIFSKAAMKLTARTGRGKAARK